MRKAELFDKRYDNKIQSFSTNLSSGAIDFADNLLRLLVEPLVGVALNAGNGDAAVDVEVLLAEVDAGDGDVGPALPRSHHGLEGGDLRVGTGLVAVEPRGRVFAALVLDLALAGTLAPAALELLVQREAHAAVVRHLLAPEAKDQFQILALIIFIFS